MEIVTLTLIFRAASDLPPSLLGGGDTRAVRISSNPIAAALVAQSGCPLTATSANRSGGAPARSADEVDEVFGDSLDLIIDGGRSVSDVPSTVVDVSRGGIAVLREGFVSAEALRRAVGP